MDDQERQESTEQPNVERIPCADCGKSYKTPQGLAGHRRLAHSASTAQALDERTRQLDVYRSALESKSAEIAQRETAAKRREAELSRRQREIEETGPSSIGLAQCNECGAWFDDPPKLRAHARSVHPIEETVAGEVHRSRERVVHEWNAASRKQEQYPDETPEQIVQRFWWPTDRRILRSLLAHNATFKIGAEE